MTCGHDNSTIDIVLVLLLLLLLLLHGTVLRQWAINTVREEHIYMKKGHLHHLTQLLNLLLTSTNVAICNIRLLFNLYISNSLRTKKN